MKPTLWGMKEASFKSWNLKGNSYVSSANTSPDSKSVGWSHRASYLSSHNRRNGFAFFIDYLTKPKLHTYIAPSLGGWEIDHKLRHFRVIVENNGRSPILELGATITTRGPDSPHFESEKTKVGFGDAGLDILNHRWPPAFFFPYNKLLTTSHPSIQKKTEIELHRKNPFDVYLLTVSASKERNILQTGDYEEIILEDDINFQYFDNHGFTETPDLVIDFYLDFEGKTKSGDSIQSKKRFRILIPSFGKIGSCDLKNATITELKDNRK